MVQLGISEPSIRPLPDDSPRYALVSEGRNRICRARRHCREQAGPRRIESQWGALWQFLVRTHLYPCFVSHLCSHSNHPSSFADGNAQADNLVSGLALSLPTQTAAPIEAALLSHAVYHQNASALHRQFHLTREQAQQIIKSCQQCVTCLPQMPEGG
jgi:hypothetical protein